MITEELIDRLVAATNEAKDTIRQCHEARRDLRLLLKEVDEKVSTVRDEVIKANNELAEREWRKAMDSINLTDLGAGLKKSFSQWTGLGKARAHLKELASYGIGALSRPDEAWVPYVPAGLKTVAKVAGVPHGSLAKIVYGDAARRMGPSKRIRPETERRILSVTLDDAAGAAKIPAGPTWKLLDDLIGRGFTRGWIAIELGAEVPALQISRVRVRATTARKVADLHRRLHGVEAPPRRTRWSA